MSDWIDGDVIVDVDTGGTQVIDVPALDDVEVFVVQGRDGTGVNLRGAVGTYPQLPTDLTVDDAGAAYVVQGSGKLYVWSGTAWPAESNGADFRGQQGNPGRGIADIFVLGTSLVFSMSDNTSDDVPVPAIQQAIDSAAAASGSAAAADTWRQAAQAAAGQAGGYATQAGDARTGAEAARDQSIAARDESQEAATDTVNAAAAAALSETNAGISEDNAAASSLEAGGAATRAENAETGAVDARDDAITAATQSQGHATDAGVARDQSVTAAEQADAHAQAAAASAEEAADVVAAGVPDATDTTKGGVRLTGDLGGTWDNPTVPGLANKADLVGGKVPVSQIPAQALVERRVVVSTAARLALTDVQEGDVAIQIGNPGRGTYILGDGAPSDPESWSMFVVPDSPVSSVNGYTGIVILGKGDVGLDRVDNTNDLEKPISTAAQTALDGKVDEVATANVAYGTKTGGVQGTWPVTSAATATTLALRGTGGTVAIGTGTAANHATTKQQLDDGLSGKSDTGHAHDAAAIASGTIDAARLPVGTGSTQVAAGNDSRIVNAVPNSRTVTAGTGLSGGGTLDVNRTLSVLYGNTAGTATQGNDARLSDQRTPLDGSVTPAKIVDGSVGLAKLAAEVATTIQGMIDTSVLAAQRVIANPQTGAYTLVLTDANKAVEVTTAGAVNLTIPTDASVSFPVGTVIEVDQMGAGKVTIVGASGVTVQSPVTPTTCAQYSALLLRKRAANLWLVSGDM